MTKDEFRAAVVEGIRRVKSMQDVSIGDDETFTQAGLDSLDSMNLVLEVETLTGLNFGEFNLSDANTINELYGKAQELLSRGS
jgi:acyl carrier protein